MIRREISDTGVIRCQILWQKCTKFPFRLPAPDPVGGGYSAVMSLLLRATKVENIRRGEKGKGAVSGEEMGGDLPPPQKKKNGVVPPVPPSGGNYKRPTATDLPLEINAENVHIP